MRQSSSLILTVESKEAQRPERSSEKMLSKAFDVASRIRCLDTEKAEEKRKSLNCPSEFPESPQRCSPSRRTDAPFIIFILHSSFYSESTLRFYTTSTPTPLFTPLIPSSNSIYSSDSFQSNKFASFKATNSCNSLKLKFS